MSVQLTLCDTAEFFRRLNVVGSNNRVDNPGDLVTLEIGSSKYLLLKVDSVALKDTLKSTLLPNEEIEEVIDKFIARRYTLTESRQFEQTIFFMRFASIAGEFLLVKIEEQDLMKLVKDPKIEIEFLLACKNNTDEACTNSGRCKLCAYN